MPDRLLSLEKFVGRKVRLELAHLPANEDALLDWSAATFVKSPAAAGWIPWIVLKPDRAEAMRAELRVLEDSSVLAGGKNVPADAYVVTTRLPDEEIKAVRLEVLPHASLPQQGPGRGEAGGYSLGEFSATIEKPRNPRPQRGRFVRLSLPGEKRTIFLSEMEVFSGGRNIALGKPAKQSSTGNVGVAERAVDGHVGNERSPPGVKPGGVGFAHTSNNRPDPWWEVDLGSEVDIDRLVVWNPRDRQYAPGEPPHRRSRTPRARCNGNTPIPSHPYRCKSTSFPTRLPR